VRDWPDGQLFHRPMRGQNSMPSHARQVDANDAWSVIHYVRQMQKTEPVAPPASAPASTAPDSAGASAGQARPGETPGAAAKPAGTTKPADANKGGK
jgi:hypothetical protein